MRIAAWKVRYGLYYWLRLSTVPLFVGVLLLTAGMTMYTYERKTGQPPRDIQHANTQPFYRGMATVTKRSIAQLAPSEVIIEPQQLGWPVQTGGIITTPVWPKSTEILPFLTIEPGVDSPGRSDASVDSPENSEQSTQTFLQDIINARHDVLLTRFLDEVRQTDRPVLISFMPEFDSPTRPGGIRRDKSLILYRLAWQHIVTIAQQQQACNITWVWCPAQPSTIISHYPGSDFVNWIGLSVVNDPALSEDGKNHSFGALFQRTHTTIRSHAAYSIRQKPILITRLASVTDGSFARQWLSEALETIHDRYPEIRGGVYDENLEAQPAKTFDVQRGDW